MKNGSLFFFSVVLSMVIFLIAIASGPSKMVTLERIINIFIFKNVYDNDFQLIRNIILEVRLPRVIISFLVGASLSVSGMTLQSIFRNPLVSPDVIGLSSGSAFGAALAVSFPFLPLQLTAFFFGLIAVFLTYFIAKIGSKPSNSSFILAGVIVSGFFTSLLTVLQFIVDPFKLQSIIHWLMGNLHTANLEKLEKIYVIILICFFWLLLFSFRMNVMALGEDEARSVGLDPDTEKALILIPAGLIATTAISVAGIIGMIGLIIPHLVKMIVGPDNRVCIPFSFFLGGNFLVVVDSFSRSVFDFELPVGVFTTMLGTPFFIYVIKTKFDNLTRF
ncbi:MAG: iron ABC transporter permease [Proteobacteria bacterium]|nr:iron ABC transporter permease [Pseudomonadota bacterium]